MKIAPPPRIRVHYIDSNYHLRCRVTNVLEQKNTGKMPTATLTKTTTTATQDRHYSLPLTGGVTPKNEPHLPLERTGQLEQLPGAESASRTRLTPALGLQFDSRLQLKQVLAMDKDTRSKVMQDLAYESESSWHT